MNQSTKIAVAGATGSVGHYVVDVLNERGNEVVPIARSLGVDVYTGAGLADALEGVDCIVDTTGAPPDQAAATAFFTTAARNLHDAGLRAGVRHMVIVSIVGCDRFSVGYNAAQAVRERAALAGPIPVRILRAAQFHELIGRLVDWGRQGDVSYVPELRSQLVAARVVAVKLADIALEDGPYALSLAPPPEIAGPRVEDVVAMARLLEERRGRGLRIEGVRNPAHPDAALFEAGAQLPGPDATLTGPTFAEWLDETYGPAAVAMPQRRAG
jgi:uncharacterized protein YbjT (DUF2867 family)